jgi:hypothetical protein
MHRDLGPGYCMFDIDRMSAVIEVGLELKRENEGFVEYRHEQSNIVFVALMEVKREKTPRSMEALDKNKSTSRARLAMAQKLDCRLLVVYATNGTQPFEFYEVDTTSGDYALAGTLSYTLEERSEAVRSFWNNVLEIRR